MILVVVVAVGNVQGRLRKLFLLLQREHVIILTNLIGQVLYTERPRGYADC